jgi:hypothetical protein
MVLQTFYKDPRLWICMKKEAILLLTSLIILSSILPITSALELTMELDDGESLGMDEDPYISIFGEYLTDGDGIQKLTMTTSMDEEIWTNRLWIKTISFNSWEMQHTVEVKKEGNKFSWRIILNAMKRGSLDNYKNDILLILPGDGQGENLFFQGNCEGMSKSVIFKRYDGSKAYTAYGTVKIEVDGLCDDEEEPQEEDFNTCQQACKAYYPNRITDVKGVLLGKIKSRCTNGYNFDDKNKNAKWGAEKYKKEVIHSMYGLSELDDEFIWQPKEIKDDDDLNGQKYCYREYGAKGSRDYNLLLDFEVHDDCVCWIEPSCKDKDKDGYGTGEYLSGCYSLEEDCVDIESEINFEESKIYLEAKGSESKKILDGYANVINGFFNKIEFPSIFFGHRSKGDRDESIADEINPGVEESVKLYLDAYILEDDTVSWLSACNDGLDNDCDGLVDCFDTGCFPSKLATFKAFHIGDICPNTCGSACNKEKGTIAAHCFSDSKLDSFKEENSIDQFKELAKQDFSDCSQEKTCVCELGKCADVCANELDSRNENAEGKNYFGKESSYRYATETEKDRTKDSENPKCLLGNGRAKDGKSNYKEYIAINDEKYSCCCDICEVKETGEKKKTMFDHILNWVIKTFDLEEKIKNDVLASVKDPTLYSSKPGSHDIVIPQTRKRLSVYICEESLNNMIKINSGSETENIEPNYWLYSLAAIMILKEKNIIKGASYNAKQEIPTFVPNEGPGGKWDENYRTGFERVHNGMLAFGTVLSMEASRVPDFSCKLCPDIKPGRAPRKGNVFSYFVYSDMLEGGFKGEAYKVEPHGLKFSKEYTFVYNNSAAFFRYSEEEFENCSIGQASEGSNFKILQDSETNITFENISFNFQKDSLPEDTDISITRVSFDCTEPEEKTSLLKVMFVAKETLKDLKNHYENFQKLLNTWRNQLP